MRLPHRPTQLAKRCLAALYDEQAQVWRMGAQGEQQLIYQEVPCHLSGKSRLSGSSLPAHQQSWGKAVAGLSYELFCPPQFLLQLGDLIQVRRGDGSITGVAGQPRQGKMCVCVSLDTQVVA